MNILEQKKIVIENKNEFLHLTHKFGVDFGYSLLKICFIKKNTLNLFLSAPEPKLEDFLEFINKNELNDYTVNFTGGRSYKLYNNLKDDMNSNLVSEFKANVNGARILLKLESNKEISRGIVVSIGTGTSMVMFHKNKVEHVGGTALGGSFFHALMKLLFSETEYDKLINLKGNRFNLDLKVSDIYEDEDPRISRIFREFTAATLGKIPNLKNRNTLDKEDFSNSLINGIGENIGIIASSTAKLHNIRNLIFCGGFLKKNKSLIRTLKGVCKMNQVNCFFLKNSIFHGAVGSLTQ